LSRLRADPTPEMQLGPSLQKPFSPDYSRIGGKEIWVDRNQRALDYADICIATLDRVSLPSPASHRGIGLWSGQEQLTCGMAQATMTRRGCSAQLEASSTLHPRPIEFLRDD